MTEPVSPTAHTPLPDPPSTADPANFDARADAFFEAQEAFGDEVDALATNAFTNATAAKEKADLSASWATSLTVVSGGNYGAKKYANDAATSAGAAATSETNAAAAAAGALGGAGTQATSATSFTLAAGSQAFVLDQNGKTFAVTQWVAVVRTSDPTKRGRGPITAVSNLASGPSPTVTVDLQLIPADALGDGPYTDWTIVQVPEPLADIATEADIDARAADKVMTAEGVGYQLDTQAAGPAVMLFGDGSDGDATVSGSATLSRDMYYRNLVIASGAALDCRGYRIFVSEILDLTAAPAGGIRANGGAGGAGGNGQVGSNTNVGAAGAAGTAGTLAVGAAGRAGSVSNAATTSGGNGTAGIAGGNGGAGAASGAAGTGSAIAAGSGGSGGTATPTLLHRLQVNLTTTEYGSTLITGGASGAGGAGAGGDGTNSGGAGGGSGAGGAVVQIFARYIKRGAGTAAGALQAKGGAGGNGGARTSGTVGGGAGGAGSGGGWVYICCGALTGAAKANAVDVSGGDGGAGGNGADATYKGGYGGGSGAGGRFTLIQTGTGSIVETLSSAAAKAAVAPSNATGGAGATANVAQFAL